MKIKLRDYQVKLITDIYAGWQAGHKNILAVSPTGSGKAMTLCTLAKQLAYDNGMPTVIMVHRKELVSQLCMTLAQLEIPHNVIAQKDTILEIQDQQRKEYGKQYYNDKSPITVASVDTLLSRLNKYTHWCQQQYAWIMDEAAHTLSNNKWGKCIKALPNARGAGFTATPQRLDKKGLGSHAFGVFDHMVIGPTVRYLIGEGYLSKYKIVVPESDYGKYLKDTGSDSKDYTYEAMNYASTHSAIVGDVVKNYLKWIRNKRAIVFADTIAAGERMEAEFKQHGINAKLLTGDTPSGERRRAVQDYRDGTILALINVDLFDEGFDVPGTYGVIMARPTKSLGKYLQICGRALRVIADKEFAIIIDHVGNVKYHELPDKLRRWTLDNIVRKRETINLIQICQNHLCNSPIDRMLHICPYCGWEKVPTRAGGGRSAKEELDLVDGDMELLDPEVIRQLERNVELEDPLSVAERVGAVAGLAAGKAAMKKQKERIEMQKKLSETIALWAGKQKKNHYTDRQIKKMFYNVFGETITVALSLPRADMEYFNTRIQDEIW